MTSAFPRKLTGRLQEGVSLRDGLLRELTEHLEELERARAGGEDAGADLAAEREIQQLRQRVAQLEARAHRLEAQLLESSSRTADAPRDRADDQTLWHIRETVRRYVPREAVVAVAGRGDPELIRLYGRPAFHFPEKADGGYAGRDPAGQTEAITQLERARQRGASFFLIPKDSFPWLSSCSDFAEYLSQRYPAIVRDQDLILYSLGFARDPGYPPRHDWDAVDDETISVILPIHNGIRPQIGDRWLHETIGSVINQQGVRLEMVIVDDGSVDGTEHVLAYYEDRAVVNVVTLEKWRGFASAMNIGAEAACGTLLARISVGDRFVPGKLHSQLGALRKQGVDVLGCTAHEIDAAGNPTGRILRRPRSDGEVRQALRDGIPIVPSSLLMRRAVWAEVGGYSADPAFRGAEDYEFLVRASGHPHGFRLANMSALLCEHRRYSGRVSRSPVTRDLHKEATRLVRRKAREMAVPQEGK
jgi:cell division protein FtsB